MTSDSRYLKTLELRFGGDPSDNIPSLAFDRIRFDFVTMGSPSFDAKYQLPVVLRHYKTLSWPLN